MIDERLEEVREFVHEHLNAAMVMVPLASPLPAAMPIRDALALMDDREFDLTLVESPQVLVVQRECLREAVEDAPLREVVTVGESPRSDRLVERSLALGEVARRLQTDSTPLLVVGHDGPEYIVSRADFTRPAGTVAALALFGALDAQLDELLGRHEGRDWRRLLSPDRLAAIDGRYERARRQREDVSPLAYLTLGERLRLVRELRLGGEHGRNFGDEQDHVLITEVRNALGHGRDDVRGDDVLAAIGVAERILDAIGDTLEVPPPLEPRIPSGSLQGMQVGSLAASREVRTALRTFLCELREFVIISSDPSRNYYVQAAGREEGDAFVLRCEVVSNEFIEPMDRLDAASASKMKELGWRGPAPNWWQDWSVGHHDDVDELAAIFVDTLRDVYSYEGGHLAIELGSTTIGREALASAQVRAFLERLCAEC